MSISKCARNLCLESLFEASLSGESATLVFGGMGLVPVVAVPPVIIIPLSATHFLVSPAPRSALRAAQAAQYVFASAQKWAKVGNNLYRMEEV